MREELKNFYWNVVDDRSDKFCEDCLKILDGMYREEMNVFEMKAMQYEVIADMFEPVIFSNSPFYYETGTMSAQCDGSKEHRNNHNHAAGWTYWKNYHLFKEQDEALWKKRWKQFDEIFYAICGPYNDVNQHFVFNYRPILKSGLKGIYKEASQALSESEKKHDKDYFSAMCKGIFCIKKMAEKFSEKADHLISSASDNETEKNLIRIKESAKRVPWEKPQSFYEALNTLLFIRKAVGTLEGIGINSFGRIDLDLYPFYENDIKKGILTKEDAYELICKFLLSSDMTYDHDMKMVGYSDHEMENTYTLGGYDTNNNFVYNDLTSMFLEASREEKIIYPKIKARFSKDAPKKYLDEINISVINGTSTVLYQNDDTTIPALVKSGKTLQEARDYIISGCWDAHCLGVESHESGSYVNMLRAFEYSIHASKERMEEVQMYFQPFDDAKSFEEVYSITLDNINTLFKERESVALQGGKIWNKVDTLPVFSSTLENCIESRKDYTEGGSKYNDDHYLCTGFPNIIDSLLAIKELCFDKKKYTLSEFLEAVRTNWTNKEEMRKEATQCHGWGDGSDESNAFAKRFHSDIYKLLLKLRSPLGGKVHSGYLNYTETRWWGEKTLATPDGRKSRDYISQGLTPSRLKKTPAVTDVIYSISQLDATLMGGNSVVNIILPSDKITLETCETFLRAVAMSSVQSLQLNCTTKEQLRDAQKHPEKYPDLIVRVAGFSAKFTSLSRDWQEEFISRNFYE